jgi:hypothetical protein
MASTLGSAVIAAYCKVVKVDGNVAIVNAWGGLVPMTSLSMCLDEWETLKTATTPEVLRAARARWSVEAAMAAQAKDVSKMKIAELRTELTDLGLDATGKKAALIARLQQARSDGGEGESTDSM